ncbi:MAG: type II 3-dehydroquinate dehydratase [Alphaproteobacteria bacterium]|nr:type II 3-dehydroquinate dehydratase [Alphaproteobacteria bacterium]
MSIKILILNGPNLNLLGTREPHIYGSETLDDVQFMTEARARELGLEVEFRQSNSESEIVDWIQSAKGTAHGIIINAGAYTHTSIAILDALIAVSLPVVEVHLSNLFKREEFRHHSFITSAAAGLITGFGAKGYPLAVEAMSSILQDAA